MYGVSTALDLVLVRVMVRGLIVEPFTVLFRIVVVAATDPPCDSVRACLASSSLSFVPSVVVIVVVVVG